jgi:hypothetical protein
MGLLDLEEPIPIFSALLVYIFAFLLYISLEHQFKLVDEILLREGIVTIGIYPNQKGEIKIKQPYGDQFYIAKAENILKPIPKGVKTYVIGVEDNIAIVQENFPAKLEQRNISKTKSVLYKIRQWITPNRKISSPCMICFGLIKRSRGSIECPNCEGHAHKDHLLIWLENRNVCPNCKIALHWDGYSLQTDEIQNIN